MITISLITYIEPANIGGLFAGLASLIFILVICFIAIDLYKKYIAWLKAAHSKDIKGWLLEEVFLDRIAAKKGINLDKELAKKNILNEQRRKTFKQRLEDEIFKEMFGHDNKSAKKSK